VQIRHWIVRNARIGWMAVAIIGPLPLILAGTEPAGADPDDNSMPQFKNVLLLKDLNQPQMLKLMKTYNAALGVKCGFCHEIAPDHTGFEKDTKKEKKVGRKMIELVNELNKNRVMDGKADCYMCHHGEKKPVLAPPPGATDDDNAGPGAGPQEDDNKG